VKSAVASRDLLSMSRCAGKHPSTRALWRRSRRRSIPVAAASIRRNALRFARNDAVFHALSSHW